MSVHHGATEARSKLLHEELTENIIGAAIEVHSELGPGLLESAYEECFFLRVSVVKTRFSVVNQWQKQSK